MKEVIFLINATNEYGGIYEYLKGLSNFFEGYKKIVIGISDKNNECDYKFVDLVTSFEKDKNCISHFHKNTVVISLHFGAHYFFQRFINSKKVILFFGGDAKDLGGQYLYKNHLMMINDSYLYNYSDLVVLGSENYDILHNLVNENIKLRCGYFSIFSSIEPIDSYCHNLNYIVVTRFDIDKNIFAYIELAKNLNKNVRIHLYGDGPLYRKFIESVNENKVSETFIFHGYKEENDKFENKNGLLLLSCSEGIPFVVLEAYKNYLPIVCFNSASSSSSFVSKGTGFTFNEGDTLEMSILLNKGVDRDIKEIERKNSFFSSEKTFQTIDTIMRKNYKKVKPNEYEKDIAKQKHLSHHTAMEIFKKDREFFDTNKGGKK